ncbi:hypothetical protein DFH09DRAFT_1124342 [Mycena vulgaris]|nr:hypothetical protein DFH09DRAFT_1124342 [Mycena vulgaris]
MDPNNPTYAVDAHGQPYEVTSGGYEVTSSGYPHDPTLTADASGYYNNSVPAALQHGYNAAPPSGADVEALRLENQQLAGMLEHMRLGYDNKFQAEMDAFRNSMKDDFVAVKAQRDSAQAQTIATIARLEALERVSANKPTRDPRVRPATSTPSKVRATPAAATPAATPSKAKAKATPTATKSTPSKSRGSNAQPSPEAPRSFPRPPRPSAKQSPPSSSSATGAGASAKSTSPNSTSSKAKQTKARKPAEHQLFKDDIDPKARTFKNTFQMHLRFIGGDLDSSAAPTSATPEAVKQFELRFEGLTVTELRRQGQIGQLLIKPSQVKFGISVKDAVKSNSKILRGFCQMEESAIIHVKTYFAKLGLATWAVDYTQTPYSAYNQAMRMAAIDTFRFLMGACAYDFLHPDTSYVNDSTLLVRLYDHTIHRVMFDKWKTEVRKPGGNQLSAERNKNSQARTRLYKSRDSYLKDNKIARRLRGMFTAKATSETESTPQGLVALAREERSEVADQLVRKLDSLIIDDLVGDGKTRLANLRKARRVPPHGQRAAGRFQEVPKGMPIQYYASVWFNDRPPQARAKIAPKLIVAFPPDSTDFFSRRGDNPLSVEQLTEKYGETVFADYDLDFEALTAGDADDEGEGDIVGSEDSEEEGDSSDAGSVASFLDDAGASDGEQDADAMYEDDTAFGEAQDSDEDDEGDEGATAGNQADFAAAFDVDMDMDDTERQIFGSDDSDSDP